jgi:hypothetical protein
MDVADHQRFTDDLIARLRADDRVIGLVALGSMAATERAPDEWSDHDFWVVTINGAADAVRAETGWLPRSEDLVVTFSETVHGRSAIYADGHLVEYAVFDDHDVEIARANVYRVLLDDCDLESRMAAMVSRTTAERQADDPTGTDRFGLFLAQLTIGVTRHGRGELLSAHELVRGRSVRTLTSLLASFVPADVEGRPDNLDPTRRFEQSHPSLAAALDDALQTPTLACARSLLSIARRELSGRVAAATDAALAAVGVTIDRAWAPSGTRRLSPR